MTSLSALRFMQVVDSPAAISDAAEKLRKAASDEVITANEVMTVFESWAKRLDVRELDTVPGIVFLRMWLRRGTLESIITRELGARALDGGWTEYGHAVCRAFPLGVIGHWPAGNIEIQPILSMTCALLGGNSALVRIPSGLTELTQILIERLVQSDPDERLISRVFMAAFDHDRRDLHEVMAHSVDGAMIWGGEEAVLQVRSLPFPHWARLAVFGPRISVAALDVGAWSDPEKQKAWCLRIARDVWQFDQQACSSPQVLFLENTGSESTTEFLTNLKKAFEVENRAHPRRTIPAALTSTIAKARASWLMEDPTHQAIFPASPDWTILVGSGSHLAQPVQGKTLIVLEVKDLLDAIATLDGNVQTLGLGVADAKKETRMALLAGQRGIDRIVKLGRMHTFVPPWDGVDLIRPMVRMVRHVSSAD
jgi:hypothetical protein